MHVHEMIQSRRENQGCPAQRHDLLSQLVDARDANQALSEEELVGELQVFQTQCSLLTAVVSGNVLIFLIAGHETTGHTLAILLGLLALYPEEQDQVVGQIGSLERVHGDLVNKNFVTVQ